MTNKQSNKKAIVSVINDLVTDQRVHRTCEVLKEKGYEVLLVGRKRKNSNELDQRNYNTKRMRLLFESGVLFYAEFQIRLFVYLLFKKSDLLFANDLDTLLPNFIKSKLSGSELIYDSHELFCEVPELKNHPFKKRIWEFLERKIIPRLKHCITVNESIAKWFTEKYNVKFHVVRNIGNPPEKIVLKTRKELGIPEDKKMILIQGAGINIDRGAEECVEAMGYLNDVLLFIIGSGDVIDILKQITKEKKLEDKIIFIDKIPSRELVHFTSVADLGLMLDKDTNMNYRFSLPNKLFDFVNAGIPLLSSKLVELESFIRKYNIGDFIESHEPKHIAEMIEKTIHSEQYTIWKNNTLLAKSENSWQIEKQKLIAVIESSEKEFKK